MSRSVAVVGGGISGLAAAWECVRQGLTDVTVLEGSPRVGGKLRLEDVGGALVDVGAESVLARRPEALDLVDELGLSDDLVHPAPVSASVVARGGRWDLPRGTLMGVPADPASARGLLSDAEVDRALAERIGSPVTGDVPIGTLVADRLGDAVTDLLVEPLLAGVYAGRSRELSARMSVPALYRAAVEGRSLLEAARDAVHAGSARAGEPVFASLRGGLGRLPLVLAAKLAERGVCVRTGAVVRRLERSGGRWRLGWGPTTATEHAAYDAVVLATPAAPSARLLGDHAPEAAGELAAVAYASMAIVTLALPGPAPDWLTGSGFLVPPTEPFTIKASTFSSVKWPWLAAQHPERTYLRASIGRHGEVEALQRPDAQLVEVVLSDLARVLGDRLPEPVAAHVQRWGGGLPQYAPGHDERVRRVRHALPEGVVVAGAAYDGVGIPACIGSGRAAAARLATPGTAGDATLG